MNSSCNWVATRLYAVRYPSYNGKVPEDLASRVIAVIAKTQRLDPASITLESTFAELKIDSLDGINLLFAFESEFNISIPDEEAKRLNSVREAVDGVSKLVAASEAAAGATPGAAAEAAREAE